ncbi:ATP-binding cassette domain-containing protein [Paenibacillus tarimensis]
MEINKGWHLEGVAVASDGRTPVPVLSLEQLRLKPDKLTLIIGRNGAGKTTLLETIAGLRLPKEGQISLDGQPLWQSGKLNRNVLLQFGISLQHSESQWFAKTVREELRYSLKPFTMSEDSREAAIAAALQEAGLSPDALERDPWTLSGGEQRRLAWACLLAAQPRWLLLDEPTAGLDAEGIRMLRARLTSHCKDGRGAIIVTHDVSALADIADEIVEIADGRIVSEFSADQWLSGREDEVSSAQSVRLGSDAVATAAALRSAGFEMPDGLITPDQLAAVIAAQLKPATGSGNYSPSLLEIKADLNYSEAVSLTEPEFPEHRWAALDPRALWAAYLFIAAAIMMQGHPLGILAGCLFTGAVLSGMVRFVRPWLGAVRMYAIFVALFVIVSGINFSPLALQLQTMKETALYFSKIFLVMLLGLPLISFVSPLRLQRAIEQGLGRLTKYRFPVSEIALTVALIFRFIPLLTSEWARFSRIVHARGKAVTVPGSVPLRDLHRVLIPFLISMLRLADQMSTALEVRGFGRRTGAPKLAYKLRFSRSDTRFVVYAGLIWLLFAFLNRILQA